MKFVHSIYCRCVRDIGYYDVLFMSHMICIDLIPPNNLCNIECLSCRFTEDIYQMTGYRPGTYWQFTWRYISPIIMIAILASSIVCMLIKNPTYKAWNAEMVNFVYLIIMFHKS